MGIFSSDYGKAGPGIAKNAPRKKSFFRFFDLFFRKFWKLIALNLITFLLCLPIVTIGPAIAGMTRVIRSFTLEKSIFMMHEFWKGFKDNWKMSVPVGLVDIFVLVSVITGLYIYPRMANQAEGNGTLFIALCVISVSFGLTLLMMNFYIFPMIVAVDLKLLQIIKTSFFLTARALLTNLITLLIFAVIIFLVVLGSLYNYLLLIIVPVILLSLLCFIVVYRSYPVIQKFVINPFYEERGEENPELLIGRSDSNVFTDKGGQEAPIAAKSKKKTIS
ncbi:MAG: DUF624 domain-containing protein [Ruminococcus sp.]|nr:DUF624 domain-containing protein [Ruminococcus sp.]